MTLQFDDVTVKTIYTYSMPVWQRKSDEVIQIKSLERQHRRQLLGSYDMPTGENPGNEVGRSNGSILD